MNDLLDPEMAGSEARDLLHVAVEAMVDGILVLDAKERIRLVNSRVSALFRLDADAFVCGMELCQFLAVVGRAAGWNAARTDTVLNNHRLWWSKGERFEVDHHFDDGTILRIRFQPLPHGRAVITYRDVTTERSLAKLVEEQEAQAERFGREIASVVTDTDAAAEAGRMLSDDAEVEMEAVTRDLMEVVVATRQSTDAMRDAARTSALMVDMIDTVVDEVRLTGDAAADAMGNAHETLQLSEQLSDHAQAIGSILDIIKDVAKQTRLLALNAAIEAVRSGEAGRGFGVVAQEVKALASQTAEAANSIEPQIRSIQAATRSVVSANRSIEQEIATIQQRAATVDATARAQHERVMAISAAIDETALSAEQVSGSVEQIDRKNQRFGAIVRKMGQQLTDVHALTQRLSSASDSFQAAY